MLSPMLAMSHDLVGLLIASDPFESSDYIADFCEYVLSLDELESANLLGAMDSAARQLALDPGRFRALGQIAVLFDFAELISVLLDEIELKRDPAQLNNVAGLAAALSVTDEIRDRVHRQLPAIARIELTKINEIRLGYAEPETDLEHVAAMQTWPGRYSIADLGRLAPVAYVAEVGAPSEREVLRVSAALIAAGFRIRRIPGDLEPSSPNAVRMATGWASDAFPLIRWSGRGDQQWRALTGFRSARTVQAPESTDQDVLLRRVVARAVSALPDVFPRPRGADRSVVSNAFSPERLREGAFDSLEMVFLGGVSRTTLQRYARGALEPALAANHNYWDFSQLVTLRLVHAFRAFNPRFRAPADKVLGRLHDIAAASEEYEVALDASGEVYVSSGDAYETLSGEQVAIPEVLRVDRALRSFVVGGGATVPDLLQPSKATTVDPVFLGGTPSIRDHRVSARSVASMAQIGDNALRSAYPEIDPLALRDAVDLGNRILAERA